MREVRIFALFSGNGSNLEHLVRSLHLQHLEEQKQIRFIGALSNNAQAFGITRCRSLKLPCEILPHTHFSTREEHEKAMIARIKPYAPHLVLLCGFMRILTPLFVNTFRCINIHPSFLPYHKGAHAIYKSYADINSAFGGVSVHYANEELDGGEIILQEKLYKAPYPTLEDFEEAIHALEYRLYPLAVQQAIKEIRCN